MILAVIGAVLIVAQGNGEINMSIISLALIEFNYVSKRVISPIYLGDAIVEWILIAWWLLEIIFP